MPVITVTLGGIGRGTVVQGWPQKKTQALPKNKLKQERFGHGSSGRECKSNIHS
jgi:hypothetical protein